MKWYSPFFCVLFVWACRDRDHAAYEHTRDSLWTVANDTLRPKQQRWASLNRLRALTQQQQDDSALFVVASERYAQSYDRDPAQYERWLAEFRSDIRRMNNPRFTSYFNAMYDAGNQSPASVYRLYDRLCRQAEAAHDTAYIVYGRLQMATLENEAGDYSGSEETVTGTLPLLDEKDPADAASFESAYDLLGESYLSRDDLRKALHYFEASLRFATTFDRRLTHENNVAFAHIRLKEYDKAIQRLQRCLHDPKTKRYPREQARLLKNLGYARFCANATQGEADMLAALDLREKNGLSEELASSYMDLAECYQTKNQAQSREFARKAYAVSTRLQRPDDRLEALRFLGRLSSGHEALGYYRTLTKVDDSIRGLRRSARNEFAHIRYEKSRVERKNEQLAQEKRRQKWIGIAWASFALSLLTVGIFLFYRFKKQKQLEAYQAETRLSRRLHDEVAGDLSKMMAFAETADLANDHNREKLLSGLDTVYGRTRDIAHSNADIATGDSFPGELRELMEVFQGQSQMIIVGFDAVPWNRLSAAKQIVVYRVIQELLTNMRKHSDAQLVTLRFGLENRSLSVHYGDNGTQKGTRRPNGLRNVENRIRVVKGRFTFGFEDGKGFRASFTIPL
ncbi:MULTISPECIES: hypothetical protein [unclassified Flavobacterium]|uniref:hypothetical protein n=1 Tax=unclassified Flavobacterium TaxID=196869 RepID=UPI001F1437D1|nr:MULTISPECIES: hypothetical protein [unclassified Flavobacterium]UMY65281.1 hypothetical protein MKO97_12325 [Flavobacterium sp. HJ-32-4]